MKIVESPKSLFRVRSEKIRTSEGLSNPESFRNGDPSTHRCPLQSQTNPQAEIILSGAQRALRGRARFIALGSRAVGAVQRPERNSKG